MIIISQSYHKHYHPDEYKGVCVVRRKNEPLEILLKRFKKKYSKSGIAKEVRERMFYEKPSVKKRRKRMQYIRAIQREEEKAEKNKEKLKKLKIKKSKQQKSKGAEKDDKSYRRQDRSNAVEKGENSRRDSYTQLNARATSIL